MNQVTDETYTVQNSRWFKVVNSHALRAVFKDLMCNCTEPFESESGSGGSLAEGSRLSTVFNLLD